MTLKIWPEQLEICIKETKWDINYGHTLFNRPIKVKVNNSRITL